MSLSYEGTKYESTKVRTSVLREVWWGQLYEHVRTRAVRDPQRSTVNGQSTTLAYKCRHAALACCSAGSRRSWRRSGGGVHCRRIRRAWGVQASLWFCHSMRASRARREGPRADYSHEERWSICRGNQGI